MSHLLANKVFDVSGLVVLVTGGGTGIGLMMAKGLAANGAKVYIGGRRKEVVEKVAAENSDTKGKIVALVLDVTDKASIENAVKVISENDGKLDVLINNAGQVGPNSQFFSNPSAPERKDTNTLGTAMFNSESFQGWADLFSINVSSVFFVSMAFLGLLEAATKAREAETGGWSASIINNTSISGQMKLSQNHFAYNASKAAGIHLTKMLSTELALRKIPIRVNSISPGPFPSEMSDPGDNTYTPENLDKLAKGITKIPSERWGNDVDIVGATLYLASPASYYANGQIITVDGGFIAVNPSVERPLTRPELLNRFYLCAYSGLIFIPPRPVAMSHLLSNKVFDVSGQVALVTGGGTGIGLMMAKGLAANGAKVYIGGRRKEVVEKVAAENSDTKGKIIALSLDVTDKTSIENAVKVISENDGKLDVLINNAGQVGPDSPFFSNPSAPERKDTNTLGTAMFNSESFQGWADLFTINISSIFFVSMAFLGLLEAATKAREAETGGWSASIINITSISGQMKLSQNHFAYNSSKAAGIHLTKMLATELALRKIPIRVNSIAPGAFPSELTDPGDNTYTAENVDQIAKGMTKVPSERWGNDVDMVGITLYLASPASYYVNGQVITVDGGFIALNPSVV